MNSKSVVQKTKPLMEEIITSDYLSYSDKKVYEIFIKHVSFKSLDEVNVVVGRFFESFYQRGKSIRVAVYNATLNRTLTNDSEFIEELEDILTSY